MPSQSSGDGAEKRIVDFGPKHRIVIQNGSQIPEHRDESGKWIPGTGFGGWCVANYSRIKSKLSSESLDEQSIGGDIYELQTVEEIGGCNAMGGEEGGYFAILPLHQQKRRYLPGIKIYGAVVSIESHTFGIITLKNGAIEFERGHCSAIKESMRRSGNYFQREKV